MTKQSPLEQFMITLLNSPFGFIVFVISCLLFFMPYEIVIVPKVAAIMPPLQKLFAGILIVCFLLLYIGRMRVFRDNWFFLAAIVFIAVLIYSTYINSVDMPGALSNSGLFALAYILIFAVFIRANPRAYLLVFYFIFFIICLMNTYTVFATAGVGMWHEWQTYLDPVYSLVGNFNLGIMYVLPMIIAGTVWASKYGRWLQVLNYIIVCISIAMAVRCSSETQLIIFVLVLVVMVLNDIMHSAPGLYKVLRIFNSAVLFAIDLALFLLIAVFQKADFIARIGYDGDFHGRYKIWEVSKSWILQKPVFGNGVETLDYTASKWMPVTDAGHSHCFFLEVPYQTGFVGTVIFFIMVLLVIIAVFRAKNLHTKWLLSTLFALTFLAGIVESYPMVFMIIVLALCFYIAKIDREDELELERIARRERNRYRRTAERKRTRYVDE